MDDPRKKPLLTKDEAIQAYYFLLKLMGPESRRRLRYQMAKRGPDASTQQRELLIRSIDQFEADLAHAERSQIVIVGPDQLPPEAPQ